MNRQQRREMARRNQTKITKEALAEAVAKKAEKQIEDSKVEIMLAAFCLTLRQNFGFGQQRCLRALHGVDDVMGQITNGELTYHALMDLCEEKCEIRIKA